MKVLIILLLNVVYLYSYQYSDAIDDLLQNSSMVKSYKYGLKGDRSEYVRSYTSLLPSLSLQQTYSNMDENSASKYDFSSLFSSIPSAGGSSSASVEPMNYKESYQTQFVVQEAISAGQIANISLQSHSYNISKYNYINSVSNTVVDFTKALYDYYIAIYNDSLIYYKKSRASFIQNKNKIELSNNSIIDLDYNQSIIDYNSAIVDEMDNKKEIEVLKNQLKSYLKRDDIPTLVDVDKLLTLSIDTDYVSIYENVDNTLLFGINKETYNLKKSSYFASFGNFLPSASLSYSWGHKQNETLDPTDGYNTWNVRLSINWSLVNFSNLMLIKTAYNQYKQQQFATDAKRDEISRSLYNVSKSIEYFKKQYRLMKKNLELSKENINIVNRRYQLNEVDQSVVYAQMQGYYNIKKSELQIEQNLVSLILNYYTLNNNLEKIFEILNIKESIK